MPASFRPTSASHAVPRCSALGRRVELSLLVVGLGLFAGGLTGCREAPRPARPEEVVRHFVQVMQSVHGDPARGAEAVSLLWEPARKNLAERAARATAAVGTEVAAGEMLAPSWFSLQMLPRSYATRIDGDWAEVTVRGNNREEVYSVRCVKENQSWRVALELPPLPPIRKRLGGVQADE